MNKKTLGNLIDTVTQFPLESVVTHKGREIGRVIGYKQFGSLKRLHVLVMVYNHLRTVYKSEYQIDPTWKHYSVKS